ncbi:MAG: hypothetical protein ACMVY4_07685 [Minwuia sp.]|uniref:hypothetical protein n=1 Tax=Minwuia sp. TaxID=2493630 RepID=UPI003A8A48AB
MRRPLLDFDLPDPAQVWLVVFLDPPSAAADTPLRNRLLGALLGLLRPGFRHVFAVSPVGPDGWLIVNPASCGLTAGLVRGPLVPASIRRGTETGRARCVAVTARRPAVWQPRGLFTCSNVIAHLTGISAHPFLTPYGLWRRMVTMRD